ncbi:MAG: hypothetical protein KKC46_00050 [Proteobacteria bacterium]|nr:hypothetical protein [Pseudomonadota bacterium]
MKRYSSYILMLLLSIVLLIAGCSTYKIKPLPFKSPTSLNNAVNIAGADIAARAFTDPKETKDIFGFDIHGAGMLPIQVVFDNQGSHALEVVGNQTFLEDKNGNLWPILSKDIAYERATKYAKTKEVFKEGAYKGLLGAAAGAVIGAAIGIVSGENVASAAGKGAAVGAAAGATIGGAIGYGSDNAIKSITNDLREKSLQNNAVLPKNLAHGILFFPGEALSAKQLRLQIKETDTGVLHVIKLEF